ncbi:transposase [Pasteuria penetrans]|uniref:transposase n=1 Tax=Pasteuria penetrans TaxID=86005 RepID=UPI000FA90A85|nr:transposase [Pasteuria penetrans]
MKRKQYSTELKQRIIKETLRVGNVAQVARENNLPVQLLYRWKKEATLHNRIAPHSRGISNTMVATVKVLRDDYERLNQEMRNLQDEVNELKESMKTPAGSSSSSTPSSVSPSPTVSEDAIREGNTSQKDTPKKMMTSFVKPIMPSQSFPKGSSFHEEPPSQSSPQVDPPRQSTIYRAEFPKKRWT